LPKDIQSNTGSAPIKKQGHTASGNHGTDPNMKGRGIKPARDLSIKRGR
jgi:hypothetical protein